MTASASHHHCGCKLLPAPSQAEQLLIDLHLPTAWIPLVLAAFDLAPSNRGKRSQAYFTARSKIGPRDPHGHMRYLGKLPADRRIPRVALNGERMDALRFARIALGYPDLGPDAQFVRNRAVCILDDCFSPEHFTAVDPEPIRPNHGILADLYNAAWPRPLDPKPRTGWDYATRPGWALCKAGHSLQVYNASRGYAYCRECAAAMRVWTRTYTAWTRRLWSVGSNDVESYLLTLWHARPDDHDDLAALWVMLDRAYNQHAARGDPRTVHAALAGADDPADTGLLPSRDGVHEPTPTMAEAIDQMLREIP